MIMWRAHTTSVCFFSLKSRGLYTARCCFQFWLSLPHWLCDLCILLLLLQRSTAVQVRSSVWLMPQNQPSGRGLLPSPTAWSSDQHPVAMLADVSRHALGRTEGRGLGFGQLVCTHTGSVWNANPLQMGTQTTMPCAQVEDSGLLGPLQSPNWVKMCLISTVVFLPVSIIPRVEECLSLSVGDRILCLRSLTAHFCKSVCFFVSCQSHMSRHPLEGYCELSCQLGKGGVKALDHLVWISWVEGLKGWKRVGEDGDISHFFPTLQQVLCSCANSQYLSSIAGALKATRNWEGSGVTIWVSDVNSAATVFHPLLSRPISVDMSPGSVRESVSNQGKREVSKLSRELFLWGDAWDTQKNLYVCLSVALPGRICQQLYWHIHNVLACPGQLFVLVVQALAFQAIFGRLCQFCV